MNHCRLCGSEHLRLYYTQGNDRAFKFYKCGVCGLVNYDMSTGLDQAKYAVTYQDPFDDGIWVNKAQTATYEFLKANLNLRGRLLDIACGNGRLLALARDDGWEVKGLELSSSLAQEIEKKLGIQVYNMDFLEHQVGDEGGYDVVVLRHVLEHVPDSISALNKIGALLKPGGYAVLEFPNIEAWDLKIKRFLQRTGLDHKKYKGEYKPGHCNEFSWKSFSYLCSRTGFRILLWQTYSYKPILKVIYEHLKIGSKARTIIRKLRVGE
jgi:SAM-dependent methyltransferase